MIGRIRGQVLEISGSVVLVDVGGVAYEVEATSAALAAIPWPAAESAAARNAVAVVFHTHFVVREDAQLLYGFASRLERDVFRDLIRINGVGPKLAMSLISSLTLEQLAAAARDNDASALVRVPGVGKKTAERLLVELKDRLGRLSFPTRAAKATGSGRAINEAEDALVALGYKPVEAQKAVASVAGEDSSTEELVRAALRLIARQVEVTN